MLKNLSYKFYLIYYLKLSIIYIYIFENLKIKYLDDNIMLKNN